MAYYRQKGEFFMEVSIKNCLMESLGGCKTILEMKLFLIQSKKQGLIFFKEDITTLSMEDTFEIYFSNIPDKNSNKSAFPVPKGLFHLPNDKKQKSAMMDHFFSVYYQDGSSHLDLFNQNDFQIHFGHDYVWFYL
jgi:hypothetical protein